MSMYIGGDKIDGLYVKKTLSPGDTISYNDLTDKPFIPTAVTDLSDASNYALKTDIQTYTAGTGIDITNGVISNTQTSAEWGNITGVLSTQSDLQSALDSKIDGSSLATVATSGDYNDLTNKPTIPEGLPSQSGNSGKFLTTNGTIASWTTLNALQNTATDVSSSINIEGASTTNTNAVTIGKTAENNSDGGVVIGYYAKSTSQYSGGVAIGGSAHIDNAYPAVALGYNSYVNTNGGVALGSFARVTGSAGLSVGNRANTSGIQSIQIGDGLNENNYSLAVGFGVISNERKNYQLLDGTTGLIPDARLSTNIARTSQLPVIDSALSTTSTNGVQNNLITNALNDKVDKNKYKIVIGSGTRDGMSNYGVLIGAEAKNYGLANTVIGSVAAEAGTSSQNVNYAIAIGAGAHTHGHYAIQIGYGDNSEANSFYVGLSNSNNYKLLGSDGKIPDDRLNTTIARTSDYYTKAEVDAMIGNIEAILQRLNSGNNS